MSVQPFHYILVSLLLHLFLSSLILPLSSLLLVSKFSQNFFFANFFVLFSLFSFLPGLLSSINILFLFLRFLQIYLNVLSFAYFYTKKFLTSSIIFIHTAIAFPVLFPMGLPLNFFILFFLLLLLLPLCLGFILAYLFSSFLSSCSFVSHLFVTWFWHFSSPPPLYTPFLF